MSGLDTRFKLAKNRVPFTWNPEPLLRFTDYTGVERIGSGAERSDFRKRGFKVGVGSRHAICYGFTFQFKMTVIGDVASSMIVFIRNRWPSGETSYCWWLG